MKSTQGGAVLQYRKRMVPLSTVSEQETLSISISEGVSRALWQEAERRGVSGPDLAEALLNAVVRTQLCDAIIGSHETCGSDPLRLGEDDD